MKVASMSTATVGEPGSSEEEQIRSAEMRTYDLHRVMEEGLGWAFVCICDSGIRFGTFSGSKPNFKIKYSQLHFVPFLDG